MTVLPDLELLSDGMNGCSLGSCFFRTALGRVRLTESCRWSHRPVSWLDSVPGECTSGTHAAVTGVGVVSRGTGIMDAWASGLDILVQAGGRWGYAQERMALDTV